ncbi:MAG: hypothetical protein V3S28_06285, partial [Acidimicrobiia bacterium]
MTGTTGDDTPASSVVDRVVAAIPADLPDEQRVLMEPFARMYLRRLPEIELPDLTPEQLLAEICDLLEFVSERPSG